MNDVEPNRSPFWMDCLGWESQVAAIIIKQISKTANKLHSMKFQVIESQILKLICCESNDTVDNESNEQELKCQEFWEFTLNESLLTSGSCAWNVQ